MGLLAKFRATRGNADKGATSSESPAQALIGQGNALEHAGQFELALERYESAVRMAPDFARAHLNKGNVLLLLGDSEDALAAYATALACDSEYVGAHLNLGNAYLQLGCLEEAPGSYVKASELNSEFADAHVAMGCVLEDLGRIPEAIAGFRQALAVRPEYAQVHSDLGSALKSAGRFDEAVQSHRRALELDPSLAQAHNNLANALKDLGRLDEAEASYRQAPAIAPNHVEAFSNLLFLHNYGVTRPPEVLFAEATAFGQVVTRGARPYTTWHGAPDSSRCLRVGLVSGDLRSHPVGPFLEGVIAALASKTPHGLRLIAYPTARCEDSTAQRIRAHCQEWHPVHAIFDEALARRIHDDAIDILIDLSGHTAYNRLPTFAWKPSPLQVSWLGYFATTGVPAIDYLIADPWTLPESQASAFTEAIWRLPETRLCFTPPDPSPPLSELPAGGGGALTFACFNNLSKVNEAVVKAWARVLTALPASQLLLKSPQLQ